MPRTMFSLKRAIPLATKGNFPGHGDLPWRAPISAFTKEGGMILPGGRVASWNHTRTVDRMSKESGSPTTRESAIGSPTTRDLATGLFKKWRPRLKIAKTHR